jgi:hypothetical protein
LLPLVKAEIMISQPKLIYNLGDNLGMGIEISEIKVGYLEVNLECGSSMLIDRSTPSSTKKDINLPLTPSYIGELRGNCYVSASYGGETTRSPAFKISDKINVVANPDKISLNPGDNVKISGEAVKENGEAVDGFVEVSLDGTDTRVLKSFTNGKFDINLSIPGNVVGKDYTINILVYEKTGDDVLNSGLLRISTRVRQEPTKIEIAIDKQAIKPGANLTFRPILYDQSNFEVDGDIKIDVKNALDEKYSEKLVKSGEEITLKFDNNASAGYWKIEASSLNLSAKRLFYVEEFEKAEFKIINDTLLITNIGNVPYRKTVQITIGDSIEVREMDLDIGESKKFRLLAPDGNYKVSVTDGSEIVTLSGVSLTGNAVGVADIKKQLGLISRYPIVWLFLIVVFGLFILMIFERVSRKTRNAGEVGNQEGVKVRTVNNEWKDVRTIDGAKSAEHSLVLHGQKEDSSIVVLRVKNPGVLGNAIAGETIDKAIGKIDENKGSLYKAGDNLVGLFVPSLTKTFKNDVTAVRVAGEIAEHISMHNKKFKEKIEFGIGVNSGEIATKIESGKLKFTSLGNTLNLAKKIAEQAGNSVLISDATNRRVSSDVKTEKKGEYFSIVRMLDREKHKAFIDGFLKRN